jgi:hypothetical protein
MNPNARVDELEDAMRRIQRIIRLTNHEPIDDSVIATVKRDPGAFAADGSFLVPNDRER